MEVIPRLKSDDVLSAVALSKRRHFFACPPPPIRAIPIPPAQRSSATFPDGGARPYRILRERRSIVPGTRYAGVAQFAFRWKVGAGADERANYRYRVIRLMRE